MRDANNVSVAFLASKGLEAKGGGKNIHLKLSLKLA